MKLKVWIYGKILENNINKRYITEYSLNMLSQIRGGNPLALRLQLVALVVL